MKKTVLALACVILAPMLLVGITASAPYDPWADLDADGDIDIYDVVKIATIYGTTGDPSKNVNVTNWPQTQDVNVTNWPEVQNTNVTNWPSLQNVNVTNQQIPVIVGGYKAISWQYLDVYVVDWTNEYFRNETAGYRQVTVGIVTTWQTRIRISFKVHGVPFEVESWVGTGTHALKTYEVVGDMIEVEIENQQVGAGYATINFYMTA